MSLKGAGVAGSEHAHCRRRTSRLSAAFMRAYRGVTFTTCAARGLALGHLRNLPCNLRPNA